MAMVDSALREGLLQLAVHQNQQLGVELLAALMSRVRWSPSEHDTYAALKELLNEPLTLTTAIAAYLEVQRFHPRHKLTVCLREAITLQIWTQQGIQNYDDICAFESILWREVGEDNKYHWHFRDFRSQMLRARWGLLNKIGFVKPKEKMFKKPVQWLGGHDEVEERVSYEAAEGAGATVLALSTLVWPGLLRIH